jgi:methionyl-tRNA synthetase
VHFAHRAIRSVLQQIDRDLLARGEKLPSRITSAYDHIDLQQRAELPVQLARLTNGYIDATELFKLAKDVLEAGRLDTVLNIAARRSIAA